MARTPQEKAIDCLLTAYLIDDAFSRCTLEFVPETKLQKLVFLSEKSMIEERKKGFNFHFIKLTHGPYSQELENSLGQLIQIGIVNESVLAPTDSLRTLLQDFRDVIDRNRASFDKINRVNDAYAGMSLQRLLEVISSMPWGRDGKTIADLPPRTPMLYPMKPKNVALEFSITEEEAEDLLMNFDPKAISELHQAMSDMREGRTRTYEQVFSNL